MCQPSSCHGPKNRVSTTEQALLTNHKPEPHVRHHPFESTKLATPLFYAAPLSCPSLVGCLSFSHVIGTQIVTGLAAARWSNMSVP
uniref:SLC26A/SulP transporter domain-containing protein n=1 Tax=Mesocestoides corti TaxID=53468 RepID=A0A5K3FYB3_MESCO